MKLRFINQFIFLLTVIICLGGCAAEQVKSSKRYTWPLPPDEPRIEWLKSYYGADDFQKGGLAGFLEIVFGKQKGLTFEKPLDIKSNGKGVIYITDTTLDGILVFDIPQQNVDLWRKSSDSVEGLGITPYYIALDSEGNIYAVGKGKKDIFVLNPKGIVLRRISFEGRVNAPGGIAVSSELKRIYLIDNSGGVVAVFDFTGKYLFSFGKPGEGDGELNRPTPIALNSVGEVIVGDTMNARVQIFDKDGKFLRKFGQRGDGIVDFQILKGIAVDSDDNIYVTDGKTNQIKIFNSKGVALLAIGRAYSVHKTGREAPGGFLLPQGIHIDGTDTIYVVDQVNYRFQVFKYLKENGAATGKTADKPEK
jgi:DNA-binding beta-propeller fold protein YncE